MKVKDLKNFNFYIGNTSDGRDVTASNKGIFVDDELVGDYKGVNIEDVGDFIDVIDDAIYECDLTDEDKDELGTYLGANITIEKWWNENVSD